MRKIKFACDAGSVHHGLAALAITQAGMMKGFSKSEGFHHEVVLEDDGVRKGSGVYHAKYLPGEQVIVRCILDTGCKSTWMFSWPQFRLLSYSLDDYRCRCAEANH